MVSDEDLIDMLPAVVKIALDAGREVLRVYMNHDLGIEQKEDDSPLTLADKAAHKVIVNGLSNLCDYAILSEEGEQAPWKVRRGWRCYWLVDPLDGTKEFIKRNGEFTVNIALVADGVPVLGVVFAPVLGALYFACRTLGAYKSSPEALTNLRVESGQLIAKDLASISVSQIPKRNEVWRVAGGRSYRSDRFNVFMEQLANAEVISMGSSLKLCMVAEGKIDLYPRMGLTSEWDTAAGQAVVEAAGGQVLSFDTGMPLRYNQKDELLNPYFVVCAGPSEQWALIK